MSGPYKDQAVLLHRDTLSLAWGFRLQGGKDFKAPLTIQRVFVGSPADGVVHRGDVLVSIEDHDTTHLAHKQAQDLIKQAGGSLRMHVRRLDGGGNIYRPTPAASLPQRSTTPYGAYIGPAKSGPGPTAGALAFVPKPRAPMPTNRSAMTFGTDYSKKMFINKTVPGGATSGGPAPGGNMLSRVNQSLNAALWQPGAAPDDYQYDPSYRPVHDLRDNFSQQAQAQPQQPYHIPANHEYREEQDYEPLPVKELKKKFNKKDGKGKKSVRSRAARDAAPPQIHIPDYGEGEDATARNRTGKQWTPPDPSLYPAKPLYQPGWSPKQQQQPPPQQGAGGWGPVQPPHQQLARPAPPRSPQPQRSPGYQVPRVQEPDVPAWAGSLHSGGGMRPWEITSPRHAVGHNMMEAPPQQDVRRRSPQPQAQPRQRSPRRREVEPVSGSMQPHQPRVQTVSYGPAGEQTYSQQDPSKYDGDAKIAHLQYNTPLGLYSKENVVESLAGQTAGGPGEGTMQVTGGGPPGQKQFDPKQSSVLRILQEQEGLGRQAPPPQQQQQPQVSQAAPGDQSARYQNHQQGQEMQYQGYMDHYKQSPSMHALEYNMSDMRIEEPSGTATSDF